METPATARVGILRIRDGQAAPAEDDLVLERAVGVSINGVEVALLMALPGCEEELAAGFALSEGVIRSRADLLAMRVCAPEEAAVVEAGIPRSPSGTLKAPFGVLKGARNDSQAGCLLRLTVPADLFTADPNAGPMVTRFACGTVGKSLLRREPRRIESAAFVSADALHAVMRAMTERQSVYRSTGGTHGAAVCDNAGNVIVLREDIGRHNAADKALGHCLLNDIPLSDKALVLTGRASSEMVLKAATAGAPILASMSAATALGVEMAQRYGLTLVGFLRPRRMNVYCGAERIVEA
jgi:FdhD protein